MFKYYAYHKNLNRLFQKCIGITCLVLFLNNCTAQVTDTLKSTIQQERMCVVPQLKLTPHSPKKAALLSTCLPGLGQAYNKKYWKMPVIYLGAAGLVYFFSFEQTNYIKYRNAYKYRIDNNQ